MPSSVFQSHGIQDNRNLKKKTRQGGGMQRFGKVPPLSGLCGMRRMRGGQGSNDGKPSTPSQGLSTELAVPLFPPRMCVSSCPAGFFGDKAARRCRRCYKGCESCVGRGPGQCTACKRSLYHHPEMGACLPLCPPGFYAEERKGARKPLVNHSPGVLTMFAGGEIPCAGSGTAPTCCP